MADETHYYLHINAPTPDTKSEYFLVIYSRPSPFSRGESIIVPCTELQPLRDKDGLPVAYRALNEGIVVAQFPGNQDYLLVHRTFAEMREVPEDPEEGEAKSVRREEPDPSGVKLSTGHYV